MSTPLHITCPNCGGVNRVPADRMTAQPKCGKCKAALFTGHPLALSSANFQTHIERSDIPVVVDFWASWCGPCRIMAPAFEQAAGQLEPRVRFAKLDTEAHQAIAARYNIRSIPTLILFHQGQEKARISGALDTQGLVNWISTNM